MTAKHWRSDIGTSFRIQTPKMNRLYRLLLLMWPKPEQTTTGIQWMDIDRLGWITDYAQTVTSIKKLHWQLCVTFYILYITDVCCASGKKEFGSNLGGANKMWEWMALLFFRVVSLFNANWKCRNFFLNPDTDIMKNKNWYYLIVKQCP